MFRSLIALPVLFGLIGADAKDDTSPKEALQALNEFIGSWKGDGGPVSSARPNPRDLWKETVSWSWRFKGNDVWLVLAIQNGKHWQGGELRYLPTKKAYELTAKTRDGKKSVFTGTLKDDVLALDRVDPKTQETQRLRFNLAAEGIRLVYRYEHKGKDRTLFVRDYQVACTKEGESLGTAAKKITCIVSGGLGKIPVSYKGTTYYVCCSGCRDAFLENPEKFIKESEARKGK